jgi:hypothetical protein
MSVYERKEKPAGEAGWLLLFSDRDVLPLNWLIEDNRGYAPAAAKLHGHLPWLLVFVDAIERLNKKLPASILGLAVRGECVMVICFRCRFDMH